MPEGRKSRSIAFPGGGLAQKQFHGLDIVTGFGFERLDPGPRLGIDRPVACLEAGPLPGLEWGEKGSSKPFIEPEDPADLDFEAALNQGAFTGTAAEIPEHFTVSAIKRRDCPELLGLHGFSGLK